MALPVEVAIADLHVNSGTRFAPAVVEALAAVVGEPPEWELTLGYPSPAAPPVSPPRLPAA